MNNGFALQTRQEGGGTATLDSWGADCEYGVMKDVLLGPATHYEWLKTSSESKKSIRRQHKFDNEVARKQHGEMVAAYESLGVNVHLLEADPALPYQIFARDSSVMTPYGKKMLANFLKSTGIKLKFEPEAVNIKTGNTL